jgi:hypothetical protein
MKVQESFSVTRRRLISAADRQIAVLRVVKVHWRLRGSSVGNNYRL